MDSAKIKNRVELCKFTVEIFLLGIFILDLNFNFIKYKKTEKYWTKFCEHKMIKRLHKFYKLLIIAQLSVC
jgi:hypothetical protein